MTIFPQVSLTRSSPLRDEEEKYVELRLTSYDRTLVVKEISSEEVEEMHSILSEYHQVLTEHVLLTLFIAYRQVYLFSF